MNAGMVKQPPEWTFKAWCGESSFQSMRSSSGVRGVLARCGLEAKEQAPADHLDNMLQGMDEFVAHPFCHTPALRASLRCWTLKRFANVPHNTAYGP